MEVVQIVGLVVMAAAGGIWVGAWVDHWYLRSRYTMQARMPWWRGL